MTLRCLFAIVALAAIALRAYPACPTDVEAALMAAQHANLQPVPNPGANLSMDDALCGLSKYARFLGQNYGRPVGYKAGLTNPAAQKQFKVAHPIRGVLFERMLLSDDAEVPAKFGARPLYEADLVVEVKDARINTAKTRLEALRHISRIYPFIELPDILVENPKQLTGPILVYLNSAARLGVLGKPFDVSATPALEEALANMTVKLIEDGTKEIDSSKGSTLLDNPLNVVLWIAEDLRKAGGSLKKGELLSLGAFSRLHAPKPGTRVTAIYDGLPGNPRVTVRFK